MNDLIEKVAEICDEEVYGDDAKRDKARAVIRALIESSGVERGRLREFLEHPLALSRDGYDSLNAVEDWDAALAQIGALNAQIAELEIEVAARAHEPFDALASHLATSVSKERDELRAEVERLRVLALNMWVRADHWTGAHASSHVRSDIAQRLRESGVVLP